MMKSQVLLLLVLSACETSHGEDPSGNAPVAPSSQTGGVGDVASGSTCDAFDNDADATFAPAAGAIGSSAIAADSPSIVAWASRATSIHYGESVAAQWKSPERALGPAEGSSTDVVSLGEGGHITLEFDVAITDRPGFDLCVFENSFSDNFLEFAYVEVASNDTTFVRFAARSRVAAPVAAYGTVDPTLIDGLAGKYRQGFCTPFDLASLAARAEVQSGELDLSHVRYVRIRDVIGDGRELDCNSTPIYDPYPTSGGAGFDLDAVAVLAPTPEG